MSMLLENVTDEIIAPMSQQEMRKRRPSGKHVYKPQLATKIKWALEDSMQRSIAAQRRMRNVLDWLEGIRQFDGLDVRVLAELGKLDHELFGLAVEVCELERIVATAITESKPAAK